MKKVIFLFTLLIPLLISAQKTRSILIDWKETRISILNSEMEIPGFDADFMDYRPGEGLFFTTQWAESQKINSSTAKIVNIIYETISKKELKNLSPDLIPSKMEYVVKSVTARNNTTAFASFSPIIKMGNSYKRVKSLDIVYQPGQNKSVAKKLQLSKSVLASGDWFRFSVDKTGVFKLTPDFLNSIGVPISSIDPNTIKIYGNGGKMLPLLNQNTSEIDLMENAIQVVGGGDGILSDNDHILFYGEDATGFSSENETNLNLYDDSSYYYITYGGQNGKRIAPYVEPVGAATTSISSFTDYQFYEVDETNIGKFGRRWFGDTFDIQDSRGYDFLFPNLLKTEPIELKVLVAAVSDSPSSMNISVNSEAQGTLSLGTRGGLLVGREAGFQEMITSATDQLNIGLSYDNRGNPSAMAYLDYISLKAQRALRGTGTQMSFYYEAAATISGIASYNISNAGAITQIWDITNPSAISSILNSNAAATMNFKANLGNARKYIAIDPTDYFQPQQIQNSKVDNQDIKGTVFLDQQGEFRDVDYLLITDRALFQAANKLADHHRALNNYNVKVLLLDQVYHEFSSGRQDIAAIRNAVKYVYDNASDPSRRLRYLGLLGDASFDYKNRIRDNNSIVPTFHSLSSFSEVSSFASDDFFGCMDPEEGLVTSGDKLDIAVGRIIADTPQLADVMVNKTISYNTEQSYGGWRNSLVLIADDVDVDWEEKIQRVLNELGDDLVTKKPFLNINKIYADAFQQESSASGNRYPKVNEAITTAFEKGAVLINYFGHGGEDGLAKEFIFNKSDAKEVQNLDKYPVFITVTCEYTKFDNPLRQTAGELLYWNAEGGAIGLITTTRSIGVETGIDINERLSEFLFPDGSSYPSAAESLRQTKNAINSNNRRVVFYIGDPALKLAIPKPNIRLIGINDNPITPDMEPIKALDRIKVSGEVTNETGTILSEYNGILSTTFFDKEIKRTTLGNDGTRNGNGEIIKLDFETSGEIIFRGKASVKNGAFSFEFVVPRDINISLGNGRISFYAQKNGVLEDQTGIDQNIIVGGLNENAPEDNIGPQVELFMNDENFVSGDITDDSPILIAKLQDDNGINTASGIGHDISAILDGDEANPFILNDFYETEVDDFTKGTVNFKFRDLEPGLHTIAFKGWDVYNNSTTQEIQFVVAESEGFSISNVLNYPNPFISQTEFWFDHSGSPSDIIEVQIQVFTVSGKVIWTSNQTLSGKRSYQGEVQWDGKDDFGNKLGKGVYVYKISAKSTLTNERVEKFEKLVIL